MAKTLKQRLERLPSLRRNNVEKRTKELIAEEMTLRAWRQAPKLAQEQMAKDLKIGQEYLYRIAPTSQFKS